MCPSRNYYNTNTESPASVFFKKMKFFYPLGIYMRHTAITDCDTSRLRRTPLARGEFYCVLLRPKIPLWLEEWTRSGRGVACSPPTEEYGVEHREVGVIKTILYIIIPTPAAASRHPSKGGELIPERKVLLPRRSTAKPGGGGHKDIFHYYPHPALRAPLQGRGT